MGERDGRQPQQADAPRRLAAARVRRDRPAQERDLVPGGVGEAGPREGQAPGRPPPHLGRDGRAPRHGAVEKEVAERFQRLLQDGARPGEGGAARRRAGRGRGGRQGRTGVRAGRGAQGRRGRRAAGAADRAEGRDDRQAAGDDGLLARPAQARQPAGDRRPSGGGRGRGAPDQGDAGDAAEDRDGRQVRPGAEGDAAGQGGRDDQPDPAGERRRAHRARQGRGLVGQNLRAEQGRASRARRRHRAAAPRRGERAGGGGGGGAGGRGGGQGRRELAAAGGRARGQHRLDPPAAELPQRAWRAADGGVPH
mmetsp:Transcript_73402/g.201584  ORF Transcript_73402/g.201584 Transcript_73402/m.201584 type:complete len:309 (-) Transcript_73402:1165-2091(-)